MKLLLSRILFIFLLTGTVFAGWRQVYDYNWHDIVYQIKDVSCADSLNCFATGYAINWGSTALKSVDGGNTWFESYRDTNFVIIENGYIEYREPTKHEPIECSRYVTPSFIVCAHMYGEITVSRDGGETFELKKKIETQLPIGIAFSDSLFGIVIGSYCTYKTTDAGETWERIANTLINGDQSFQLYTVQVQGNNIYLGGSAYHTTESVSALFKSTDRGATWSRRVNLYDKDSFAITSIYFINATEGWIAGVGNIRNATENVYTNVILHTSDGGETWEPQLDTIPSFGKYGLTGIYFPNSLEGIAWGFQNIIWRTSNGGKLWEIDSSFRNASSHDAPKMAFPNKTMKRFIAPTSNYSQFWLYDENLSASDPKAINMEISPNPATDFISIPSLPGDRIEIYSQLGVKVLEAATGGEKIDVSRLPAGLYFIRSGGGIGKFIKSNY